MNKIGSSKKGYVLLYVILTIVLATLLASALYSSVFLTNRLFMQQQNIKLANYVAVSGVEYAFYIIKCGHYTVTNNATWPRTHFDPTNGAVAGVDAAITIAQAGTNYTITSVGTYPGATKTITVTCTSTGSVTSWRGS